MIFILKKKDTVFFIVLITILVFFTLTSLYSFLLFHTLAELFSIVIAGAIFIIAWNSRDHIDSNYLLFIGIAYLFIGGIDFLHTLAYKGMNIFAGFDADLPTQLWIAGRYLEAGTLIAAALLITRKINVYKELAAYFVISAALIISIFSGIFPVCYIEGQGLTGFKIVSEYIICTMLALAVYLLYRRKENFEPGIFSLIIISIFFTILSELAFTFYVSVYGLSNLVGHLFKIVSFALIYYALVESGIRRPYEIIFRNLAEKEKEAAEERDMARMYMDVAGVMLLVLDSSGIVRQINRKGCEMLGYDEDEITGKNFIENFIPADKKEEAHCIFLDYVNDRCGIEDSLEYDILTKNRETKTLLWQNTLTWGRNGKITGTVVSAGDITELKKTRDALKEVNRKLNLLSDITRHDILNQITGAVGYLELIELDKEIPPGTKTEKYISKLSEIIGTIQRQITFTGYYKDLGEQAPGWFDVGEIVRYVSRDIALGEIELNCDIKGVEVFADPLFGKVIYNLMDNAVKHGETLTHITFFTEKRPEELIIFCEDDGVGIPDEFKEKIFKREHYKNSGLGLFLSGEILGITGLTIDETGTPGRGARFGIHVPADKFRKIKSSGGESYLHET